MQRARPGERVDRALQPVDEFGELAGQLDPIAADIVEGQRGVDPGVRVVGHRDAGQHPVDAEPPGVVDEVDPEGPTVLLVEAPPDVGLADPAGDAFQIVVGEAEPGAHRRGLARLSTSLAVTLPPASASNCDAVPSSGFVCSSERSASRTLSRCAGCARGTTSPSPKSAIISGA